MDVDTMHLGGMLTDEEKKTLQQENKCFYCKIKGHILKDCRKKATNRAAAAGTSITAMTGAISMDTQTTETTEITNEEHLVWFQSHSISKKLDINEKIFAEETEQDF